MPAQLIGKRGGIIFRNRPALEVENGDMRPGLSEGVSEEKNAKKKKGKKESQCCWIYFRFSHGLFVALVNSGGSKRQCWRVPIFSITAENEYTRKRRQMRLAKGLDFLEKFLTY
jgi:hypothetical protein